MKSWHISFSCIALCVMILSSARSSLAIPDATEAEIRKMLTEYHTAIKAGDLKKALTLCIFQGAEEEKLVKLTINLDVALHKLHVTVDQKLGEKAWGPCGELLGEMTETSNRDANILKSDEVNLFVVFWYHNYEQKKGKRVEQFCPVRKTNEGWRFEIANLSEEDYRLELRKSLRDEIAELEEITAAVNAGTLPSPAALRKRIEKLVNELVPDAKNEIKE